MDRTTDILFREPALGPCLLLVLLMAFKATTSIDPACLVNLPALSACLPCFGMVFCAHY
jgi:hypothetical protein